jgi:putative ubiquitin-RnfH superfamily antitoxin RatB of RatAB toxin-antitoxin module
VIQWLRVLLIGQKFSMQDVDTCLRVEIVYALANHAHIIPLRVPVDYTIRQAIQQSEILKTCSEIDLSENKVGVFNKIKQLDDLVKEGDRIEIYRPLLVEPKEARRRRAEKQKAQKN